MSEILKTERLILRPMTAQDGARVIEILNDFNVSKWLARIPHPFGAKDLRIKNLDGSSRWPGLAGIELDGLLIGAISLRAEHLGYWLDRDHWGQGFGTEAARAGCEFIFGDPQTGHILSGVFEGNMASQRILERLGFEQRERNYIHCAARDREIRNLDYRLTRDRWAA